MERIAHIDWLDSSDKVSIYTLVFENEDYGEYLKFLMKFQDVSELNDAYLAILTAIKIILKNGALERYFKPEGKFEDGITALPLYGGKLRLYCLRVSDKILFLGNGGVKTTRTYNEDPELNGYVIDLQNFEKLLNNALKEGVIKIEENKLTEFENVDFKL